MSPLLRLPGIRQAALLAWKQGRFLPTAEEAEVSFPDGRRLVCSTRDHTQRKMLLGEFESAETDVVRAELAAGGTFVDVGAHIGWFTVLAGHLVGPTGAVLAFEPFPASFERLRRNVSANGLDHVRIEHVAVSSSAGELTVGVQAGSDSGSVTAGPGAAEGLETVHAQRLDDLVDDDVEVDLLKIDVEGHEAAVLAGGPSTLARTRAVLVELNAPALSAAGSGEAEVLDLLADAGLRPVHRFAPQRLHRRLLRRPVEMENVLLRR